MAAAPSVDAATAINGATDGIAAAAAAVFKNDLRFMPQR
jgi:hypothetical protein